MVSQTLFQWRAARRVPIDAATALIRRLWTGDCDGASPREPGFFHYQERAPCGPARLGPGVQAGSGLGNPNDLLYRRRTRGARHRRQASRSPGARGDLMGGGR